MVKFDIRDLICDGYGFTAEQSGMNRLKAKYVQKINDKFKLEKAHHCPRPRGVSAELQQPCGEVRCRQGAV